MKLRNKLIFSCAALAACATTMVSTTFAWYTSNTAVSANGIDTSSAAVNQDALLISLDGKEGNWKNTVSLAAFDDTASLVPVQFGSDGNGDTNTFYKFVAGDTSSASGAATSGTDYIEFSLYFKNMSTATSDVYLSSLTVTNTTSTNLPAKDVLTTVGLKSGFTPTTYTVDILRALAINFEADEPTSPKTDLTSGEEWKTQNLKTNITTGNQHVTKNAITNDSIDVNDTAGDPKGDVNTVASSANAHEYFNDLATTDLSSTTDKLNANDAGAAVSGGADGSEIKVCTLSNDNLARVTIRVFLNGWDIHCFDACASQKFTVNLGFTTDVAQAMQKIERQ